MKNKEKIVLQSCDSRTCRKEYKEQITNFCDAITTRHILDTTTKEIKCTNCGKSYKLSS